jgi:hypothetical protein
MEHHGKRSSQARQIAVESVVQFQTGGLPAPLDRAWMDLEKLGRLRVSKSLIPDQIEDLAFFFRQCLGLLMKLAPQGQPARLQGDIGRSMGRRRFRGIWPLGVVMGPRSLGTIVMAGEGGTTVCRARSRRIKAFCTTSAVSSQRLTRG